MPSVRVAFDMRAPDFGTPAEELYRAAVEQSAWADRHGFEAVTLSEHHAAEDGYLPSPIVLGSAIAAVTSTMLIELSALIAPLYHPIRLAEDLAVLDLISGGRLRIVLGMGYRQVEYEQLGVNMKRRPSMMVDTVETLKDAWAGVPFERHGVTTQVLPRPAQRPRPKIALAGASPASARRAAQIADDYRPLSPKLYQMYLDELARIGAAAPPPHPVPSSDTVFLHVAEDPDAAWARIAPHAIHETNSYGRWAAGLRGAVYDQVTDADELRRRNTYKVLTPPEAIAVAHETGGLTLKPLMGGMPPELGWECLHVVAEKVLPALRG